MLQGELERISRLSESDRASAIEALANRNNLLEELMAVFQRLPKSLWVVAIQTIHAVGYPKNRVAAQVILDLATDSNAPGWENAVQTLVDMDPEVVIPLLVAYLLDRTQHQYWAADIEEVC